MIDSGVAFDLEIDTVRTVGLTIVFINFYSAKNLWRPEVGTKSYGRVKYVSNFKFKKICLEHMHCGCAFVRDMSTVDLILLAIRGDVRSRGHRPRTVVTDRRARGPHHCR